MQVVSRAVAGRYESEVKTSTSERFTLEGIYIAHRLTSGEHTPSHIYRHSSEVLCQRVGLSVGSSSLHLVDERLRHGLTRLVVAGIVSQDDRVRHPVLVELRGHFHEVAGRIRTRERLVLLRSEEAMQSVAELMEERLYIRRGEEGGSALSRSLEVADVVDDRLRTEERALLDEVRHPRPTRLRWATEVVRIEESHGGIILVEDLVDLYAISIDRDIRTGLEGQAIELVGCVEDSILQHAIQHEIGLEVGFVEVVLSLLQALSIVVEVPSSELEVLTLSLLSEGFEFGDIVSDLSTEGGSQLADEALYGLGTASHLVAQCPRGEVGQPEELCLLGAQGSDAGDRGVRIRAITTRAARERSLEDTATDITVVQVGKVAWA